MATITRPETTPIAPRTQARPLEGGVVCVGVSHQTAPLALRERLALSRDAIGAMLAQFGCGRDSRPIGVSELVVLATCNRLELYAAGSAQAADILLDRVASATGVPRTELDAVAYVYEGDDAVRHLCRTAAGLESMIVGESQVLGQVSDALATAMAHGAAGHALTTIFRGAVRAGRRARVETGINHNSATVSSAAVKLATSVVDDLASATVLVVGAGQTAELAVRALQQRGAERIVICSRTREHAEQLTDAVGGAVIPFEQLADALAAADIVVASTSAPHHLITRGMVASALWLRPDRPLVILDLAVPRDVDPDVASVPGVWHVDLDDLQRNVAESRDERAGEIPRVEAVVDEETRAVADALRQLGAQPLIADLRHHAEAVRRTALEQSRHHFAHLSEADRAAIAAFSESLVNRLLHEPMRRLRHDAAEGQAAGYAMALRHLFGLGG